MVVQCRSETVSRIVVMECHAAGGAMARNQDAREAIAVFTQKRPPMFTGR